MNLPLISFITGIFLFLHIADRHWRNNSFHSLICNEQVWNRPSPLPTAASLVSTMFLCSELSMPLKPKSAYLQWQYNCVCTGTCVYRHNLMSVLWGNQSTFPFHGDSPINHWWQLWFHIPYSGFPESLLLVAKHVIQASGADLMEGKCWTPDVNISQLYMASNCNDIWKFQSIRLIMLFINRLSYQASFGEIIT